MRVGLSLLLIASFSLAGDAVRAAVPDPVVDLYRWVVASYRGGLPDAGERLQLSRWLAPSLLRLLRSASAHEVRCIRAAEPDEKPRIIEGNLFSGDEEPSSRFRAHRVQDIAGRRWQQVDLIWVPEPGPYPVQPVSSQVQVRMRRHDGGWRIDDIVYRDGRALSGVLAAYVLETSCATPWSVPGDADTLNEW